MRRLTTLVAKEWRDARGVTVGCALLALAVSWCVQRWVFRWNEPEWTAKYLVPSIVGVHLVLLASDLVSHDLRSRRLETFALLPSRALEQWLARFSFLVLAGAGFLVWTLLCQVGLLAAAGHAGRAGQVLAEWTRCGPILLLGGLCAAATLVASTLGLRGLVAAALGTGTVLATFAALAFSDVADALRLEPAHAFLAAGALALLCAATSLAAFSKGRVHVSRKRAMAVAGVVVGPVLLTTTAAAAVLVHERYDLDPGDEAVWFNFGLISPDGRHLALNVGDSRHGRVQESSRVWVLRPEDGQLFETADRGLALGGWTRDGGLCVYEREGTYVVEPESGEALRTLPPKRTMAELVPAPWRSSTWFRFHEMNMREKRWTVGTRDGGFRREVTSHGMPVPLPDVGRVLCADGKGAVCEVDLETGESRTRIASGVSMLRGWNSVHPSGRWLLAQTEGGLAAFDLVDGGRVAGPWPDAAAEWIGTRHEHLLVGRRDSAGGQATFDLVLDVGTWRETRLERPVWGSMAVTSIHLLPSGGFVVTTSPREIVHLDGDGRFVRRLYPPAE